MLKIKGNKQRFARIYKIREGIKKCDSTTGGCGHTQPKFSKSGLRIIVEHKDENYDQAKDRKQTLHAEEALKVLQRISD